MQRISTSTKTAQQITHEIFVDLDGVLADFTKGAIRMLRGMYGDDEIDYTQVKYETSPAYREKMWAACAHYHDNGGELWYELELMEDAMHLWDYVKPHNPQILSATGNPKYNAEPQKRRWVAEKFGEHVVVNLTEKAALKSLHAAPNRILIDDKPKAIIPWREQGGIGIVHTSAENTILELKELGL